MKRRKRTTKRSRAAICSVMAIALILIVIFAVQTKKAKEQQAEIQAKEQQIAAEIAQEEQISRELEEYRILLQSRQYIEKLARERFGLVYEDEILVRPE